ncbi:ammonium transporter [Companilactobacillus mishanensis]|uniref:Ammonium transporter n=1 Tax=Companilactobacillus mishanensis TaxID=2486008 RepID=A0A5P0ZIC8_9LACO|nr:ammonium transporter [Companilactobacillus mishanensis]MQS52755.1 ammonium transporter [Companilactobacillus mishanensis]
MNIVFMLLSTILVWLMVPGIAVFYSGFVPKRDITRILFNTFLMFGIAGLMWIVVGFPLTFGTSKLGIIGNLQHIFLTGIDLKANYGNTGLPTDVYLLFQMMFAVLTPALFLGAVASRARIKFIAIFVICWSILVYYPMAHFVWSSNGFLAQMGVLDFAGGTVIHINAGITAMILAITLRKPYKYNNENVPGNPMWILMGTVLLWIGWYGFNAGSALQVNTQAIDAFFTTTIAACSAMMTWTILEKLFKTRVSVNGLCTGAICGLVGITPGTGYVSVIGAFIIGIVSALGSFYFINNLKYKLHLNDYLDIFGSHGVSGIIGSLCVGLFANKTIDNNVVNNGLFYGGGFKLLGVQFVGVIFTIAFVSIIGVVIVFGVRKLFKNDVGIDAPLNLA